MKWSGRGLEHEECPDITEEERMELEETHGDCYNCDQASQPEDCRECKIALDYDYYLRCCRESAYTISQVNAAALRLGRLPRLTPAEEKSARALSMRRNILYNEAGCPPPTSVWAVRFAWD